MPRELVSRNTRTKTITNAVRATTPTFNCDHRTFSRSAMLYPLLHELRDVWIGRCFQPVLVALEDQPAFAQNHKSGSRGSPRPVTCRLQTPLFRIVAEIRDQVPVLISVRNHERCRVADI